MTPEVAIYLAKSDKILAEASAMLSIELCEAAARAAYLAAFHAAQALIFDRTGKVAKTHSGVKSEFHRVMRDVPHFDDRERAFLSAGYGLRTIADYDVGPDATISRDEALAAIATARRSLPLHVRCSKRVVLNRFEEFHQRRCVSNRRDLCLL